MPWTPKQFKDKHAKKLSKKESEVAAKVADALLETGMDEGEAIAVGITKAKATFKPNKKVTLKPKKNKKAKKAEGVKESSKGVTYKPKKMKQETVKTDEKKSEKCNAPSPKKK